MNADARALLSLDEALARLEAGAVRHAMRQTESVTDVSPCPNVRMNGLLFAAIVGVIAYFWFDDELLAIAIGSAMFVTLTVAGLSGIAIPYALQKMGLDPAASGGVFLTTVTDVVGFFSFLGLATLILL